MGLGQITTLNMVTTELQEDEGHGAFLLFTCCSE